MFQTTNQYKWGELSYDPWDDPPSCAIPSVFPVAYRPELEKRAAFTALLCPERVRTPARSGSERVRTSPNAGNGCGNFGQRPVAISVLQNPMIKSEQGQKPSVRFQDHSRQLAYWSHHAITFQCPCGMGHFLLVVSPNSKCLSSLFRWTENIHRSFSQFCGKKWAYNPNAFSNQTSHSCQKNKKARTGGYSLYSKLTSTMVDHHLPKQKSRNPAWAIYRIVAHYRRVNHPYWNPWGCPMSLTTRSPLELGTFPIICAPNLGSAIMGGGQHQSLVFHLENFHRGFIGWISMDFPSQTGELSFFANLRGPGKKLQILSWWK